MDKRSQTLCLYARFDSLLNSLTAEEKEELGAIINATVEFAETHREISQYGVLTGMLSGYVNKTKE